MFLTQIDPAFLAGEGGGTPSLDLFFSASKALDPRITFVRASVGTYIDENGALQTASSGVARFTHNPSTLASLGLLVEESRINILLNSATLSTQSVTTTATAYTLSFTGTGTITLSGTSTAGPLVGTGTGEANRVALTFTPTAGTLTLTVSGTVSNAQLEAGSFRTSYIPTTGSQATRAADVATMTGTNFSAWFNASEGTFTATANFGRLITSGGGFPRIFAANDGTASNGISVYCSDYTGTANRVTANIVSSSSSSMTTQVAPSLSATSNIKVAFAYSSASGVIACNGNTAGTDTSVTLPTVNQLRLGGRTGVEINGTIARLTYYRRALGANVVLLST